LLFSNCLQENPEHVKKPLLSVEDSQRVDYIQHLYQKRIELGKNDCLSFVKHDLKEVLKYIRVKTCTLPTDRCSFDLVTDIIVTQELIHMLLNSSFTIKEVSLCFTFLTPQGLC
jgi:hypothetical protein